MAVILLLWIFPKFAQSWPGSNSVPLPLENQLPYNSTLVVPRDFVSFSIEFAFWPDFAGNKSHPNGLSAALFDNLREFTHAEPVVRIGGITQDHTLFVPGQEQAIINNWNYNYSTDRPENQTIGQSFWETFQGQNHLRYIFGLNFCSTGPGAITNIQNEVGHTLAQVPRQAFHSFELGNEVDAYPLESLRPATWTQLDYVNEWISKTRHANLPKGVRMFAPSYTFFETGSPTFFDPFTLWNSTYRYDRDGLIDEISQHGYISSTAETNNTLQGTLMNHTGIVEFVKPLAKLNAFHREHGRTFTVGETNSISGQGAEGISDVFGAALWTVDYCLYAASQGISRLHFHQGTSYRYGAWQPTTANGTNKGVRPPYYGLAFAAKFLGSSGTTQISNIDLETPYLSAYAAYESGILSRLAVANLHEYNSTGPHAQRPTESITFDAPLHCRYLRVEALMAPASGSNSSITLAGISYNHPNDMGHGVAVSRAFSIVRPRHGQFKVPVRASEAYILTFI